MGTFTADVRQSFRNLIKTPTFTIVAVAVLALAIGANTVVFTLLNTLLLRPLPYPNSDELVLVGRMISGDFGNSVSIPKFNVWKRENRVLDHMSAFDQGGPGINIRGTEFPEQVKAIHVSADYFPLFGARTKLGRTFSPEEDRPGGQRVAVLSHGLWTRAFGSATDIIGRSVSLGDDSYTIIGILDPSFRPQPKADVWLPLQPDPNSTNQGHYLAVAGRLKPGATLEAANAQLKLVGDAFRRQFPEWMDSKETVSAVFMQQEMAREFRPTLLILMGAVTFVLLIACANLASLLLARALGRQKALAVRLALGATRKRLIRQLLTESVLLAVVGGIAGLTLAYWGVRALMNLVATNIPGSAIDMTDMSIMDWRVLLFTIAVSIATGALFGIFPAVQFSRPDLASVLQQTGGRAGIGKGQHRTRSTLVIGEIALALILLISATLLIRTISALRAVDPGFDPRNVIIMETSLSSSRYTTNQALENLSRQTIQRLESIPGVISASATVAAPLIGAGLDLPFTIEGKPPSGGDRYNGDEQWRFIGPHYFDALRIPIKRGRVFSERDNLSAPLVMILNETMARKYWPNDDAIGKRLTIGKGLGPQFDEPPREVIGIVGDVREEGLNKPAPAVMYVPMAQLSDGFVAFANAVIPVTWIVHTSAPPLTLAEQIRKEFLSVDDHLAVARIRALSDANAETLAREKISMNLLSVFATVALLLAAVGIYGLMSHSVEQRTRELGLRVSLGATRGNILRLILGRAIKLTGLGVLLGVLGAIGLTRLLSSLLFGVKPTDPGVFVIVSLVLTAVALIAAYIPARRATTVDPLTALRMD
ncbi:MAG TPA: ABC transporter permease [Terriglobia bacterium]|nr:ABC transporter permease [Terriglobia bacterium]